MGIKGKVDLLVKKYDTRNPLELIRVLNVILIYAPLVGVRGFYQYYQRNNIIYIDEKLPERERKFVVAHELGHMFFHKKSNFIFMDTHTNFNCAKYEIEANKFAMELLISDDDLFLYKDCSIEQKARVFGCDKKMIELRLTKM